MPVREKLAGAISRHKSGCNALSQRQTQALSQRQTQALSQRQIQALSQRRSLKFVAIDMIDFTRSLAKMTAHVKVYFKVNLIDWRMVSLALRIDTSSTGIPPEHASAREFLKGEGMIECLCVKNLQEQYLVTKAVAMRCLKGKLKRCLKGKLKRCLKGKFKRCLKGVL